MDIHIIKNKRKAFSIPLNPPGFFIGRESDNDLSLDDSDISRYHCKIFMFNGDWYIRDTGSNGTYINKNKITKDTVLKPGDIINISKKIIAFGKYNPAQSEKSVKSRKQNKKNRSEKKKAENINLQIMQAVQLKKRKLRKFSIITAVVLNSIVLLMALMYFTGDPFTVKLINSICLFIEKLIRQN